MTVSDLLKRSYRLARVTDSGETLEASLQTDGLSALNSMLASWSAEHNAIFAPTTVTHALVSGTASYTVGSSATIDTPRPKRILTAFARLNNIDYPIEIIANKDYQKEAYKTSPGTPDYIYLEGTYPNATITLYPVPDQAYVLHLKLWSPLSSYSAVTASLGLPEEYEDALAYNLAIRLAAESGTDPSMTVALMAQQTRDVLKRLNAYPVPRAVSDPLRKGRRSNILGDQ